MWTAGHIRRVLVGLEEVARHRDLLVTNSVRVARRQLGKSDTQAQQGLVKLLGMVELLGMVVLHGLPSAKSRRGREGYPGKRRGREGEVLRGVSEPVVRLDQGLV
jgi:hypothetical protein